MFTIQEIIENKKLINNYKSNDYIALKCTNCNNLYYKLKRQIQRAILHKYKSNFCSKDCYVIYKSNGWTMVNCLNCNKQFKKRNSEIKKYIKNFCSHSCSATYNNKHKNYGTKRSKLEVWLEKQLKIFYPDINIQYNKKDAINSELDIYIPSLKLAFELNGIFHYEPIFGETKLNQIQNNDQNKFQQCIKEGISLCIVDVSAQKYVKPKTSQKYLDIITNIINDNIKLLEK